MTDVRVHTHAVEVATKSVKAGALVHTHIVEVATKSAIAASRLHTFVVEVAQRVTDPPPGLQVRVWSGTAEIPASVTVWDGAAEIPAVVEQVI